MAKEIGDVIKLRISSWKDYFWLLHMGSKCNHMYPCKREAEQDLTQNRRWQHDQDGRPGLTQDKAQEC